MSLRESLDKNGVIRFFKEAIDRKKLSSAYLFTQEAEDEKKDAALEVARLILCQKAYNPECDCYSCRKVRALEHPDVIWIEALGTSASIKIEQIRNLRKKVNLKPYEADKKIFIINQAQMMTEEAQNALLKTLEEPPSDSVIILISSNAKDLLKTITSRCQIIKFKRKLDISNQLQRYEIIDRFLLAEKDNIEDFFDCQTKDEFLAVIESLLGLFRDVFVMKTTANKSFLLYPDRKDKIAMLREHYSKEDLYKVINFLNQMCSYARFNLNLRNCIMNTVLTFKEIMESRGVVGV